MSEELLEKAHVKGHLRHGHYVRPYERGEASSTPQAHPRLDEKGKPVIIKHPHHPSLPSTWDSPHAVATFVPDGDVPTGINGIPFREWKDHPRTDEGWNYVDGLADDLVEPPFYCPPGKKAASGVVVVEPDGRIWLIAPTNGFGSYDATFPKGGAEPGLSLQGNAAKEAWEESGLQVKIKAVLGDFERTTSKARMYLAERVGGDPTKCGWETQAVRLCPPHLLYELLNGAADHPIAEMLGAGPAPKKASLTLK